MCLVFKISSNFLIISIERLRDTFMDLFYCKKCNSNINEQNEMQASGGKNFIKGKMFDLIFKFIFLENQMELNTFVNNNKSDSDDNKPIEKENFFFRNLHREHSEKVLKNRVCGNFLIRLAIDIPDKSVKYILSLVIKNIFFHLFVRKIRTDAYTDKYAIGHKKQNEKLFSSLQELVRYYSMHKLKCTKQFIVFELVLIPINY